MASSPRTGMQVFQSSTCSLSLLLSPAGYWIQEKVGRGGQGIGLFTGSLSSGPPGTCGEGVPRGTGKADFF